MAGHYHQRAGPAGAGCLCARASGPRRPADERRGAGVRTAYRAAAPAGAASSHRGRARGRPVDVGLERDRHRRHRDRTTPGRRVQPVLRTESPSPVYAGALHAGAGHEDRAGVPLSALGNAKLGGGTMTEPLVTQASHQGFAEVLYPAGAVIPGAILSVLQYSPQFAAEQPDAATRFMVGYLRGVRDYYDAFHLKQNRDAAINLLVQHLSVKDPVVWETYSPSFTDLNGKVDVDDLKDSAAFYAQNGMLNGPSPDVTQFV